MPRPVSPPPIAPPVTPPIAKPVGKTPAEEEMVEHLPIDPSEDEWRSLPMELSKEGQEKSDVDLEHHN